MIIDGRTRSGNKDVDAYIEALEEEILSYGSGNTRKLLRSIDRMAGKLSKDMDLISDDQTNPDGTEVELSGKKVNLFLQMVKESEKIKAFSDLLDEKEDQIAEETTGEAKKETPVEKRPVGNMFEEMQKKVKERQSA